MVSNWRVLLKQKYGQYYYDSLRDILRELGVSTWIKVWSAFFLHGFYILDVYFKRRCSLIDEREARWYLVNSAGPTRDRWRVSRDDWDQCLDWVWYRSRDQGYF